VICLNRNHANFHFCVSHWLALVISDLEMDLIRANSNGLLKNNGHLVPIHCLSQFFCSAICQSRYGDRHQQQEYNRREQASFVEYSFRGKSFGSSDFGPCYQTHLTETSAKWRVYISGKIARVFCRARSMTKG